MPTILSPVEVTSTRTTPENAPKYRVLLHNDDSVEAGHVVMSLQEVAQLSEQSAINVMITAHHTGMGLVKVCDQEMAEFYVEALRSKGLTMSMEPEE